MKRMSKAGWRIGVLALALAIPGAWAQSDAKNDATKDADKGDADKVKEQPLSVPPEKADLAPKAAVGPDYVIGADDTLHITVWKEPDLTETLPVRPDGKISMPLLNDVDAAGLTPQQLGEGITEKLKKYIADPRVTVVVTQMNSQRVYVLGEVQHTGALPLLPNMTVLQALASAGFTQFANTKGIYVLRTESGKQKKYPVNYRAVLRGGRVDSNLVLKPGDTIVVP